jgi:hypothetical protein
MLKQFLIILLVGLFISSQASVSAEPFAEYGSLSWHRARALYGDPKDNANWPHVVPERNEIPSPEIHGLELDDPWQLMSVIVPFLGSVVGFAFMMGQMV